MRALLALLLVAAAAPTPELRYFHYERLLTIPANASGQVCAVLDLQTFEHASLGLSDLRLYRGVDETPYIIRYARSPQAPQPTITPINKGQRSGKTVFDASMPDGEYTDLTLNLSGQDFLATVAVFGSQTVAGPQTRIGAYTIFDFAGQHLGRSTVLHLPRSNYRYLHFEITGPIAPDHIISLAAASVPPAEPRYLTILQGAQFIRKGRTSVAEFAVPPNVPVDRILFVPSAQPQNFSRNVEVVAKELPQHGREPEPAGTPMSVASGNLLRIHREVEGHHIDEELLSLDVSNEPFATPTQWTITMENGDDAPVPFSDLQIQTLERTLCFEVAPASTYLLFYGDPALSAPRYDYATWSTALPDVPLATLGPQLPNPDFHPRPDQRPFTEQHPMLLWIALIFVILLLGLIALRSARRMQPPAKMP